MKKYTLKRISAYLIDIILVVVISSLFSKVSILNPNIEEYNKVYDEYTEYIKENKTAVLSNDEKMQEFTYTLSYEGRYVSIITIVITIIYFIVFQFLNKGQTIGKKLMKIKIVTDKNKNPSFLQVVIRSIIINSVLINIILVSCVFLLSKTNYVKYSAGIQLVDMSVIFLAIIVMLFSKDGRTIHDYLTNTKIESETIEQQNIKEAKVLKEKNK